MSSMKSRQDVLGLLERKLKRVWAQAAAGEEYSWEPAISLGAPTGAELQAQFSRVVRWLHEWRAWATEHGLQLDERSRRVSGTPHDIPVAVLVPNPRTAARVVGGDWQARLDRGRVRAQILRGQFDTMEDPVARTSVVRKVAEWTELDFHLLLQAGRFFRDYGGDGRTPRQIPIAGMHAKWLNTSQDLVRALSGRDNLDLARPHPSRVNFTYLDPDHVGGGGRRHDCHSVGDTEELAYTPQVVLICENKDTVVAFPKVPGGIAIEGNGDGPGAIAALRWVREAPLALYWGDMDTDGLAILSQFRTAGIVHQSLLMDLEAYKTWSQWGTGHDRHGKPLGPRTPLASLDLEPGERALYELLCSAEHVGPRRVEQERIPLEVALKHLQVAARRGRGARICC